MTYSVCGLFIYIFLLANMNNRRACVQCERNDECDVPD